MGDEDTITYGYQTNVDGLEEENRSLFSFNMRLDSGWCLYLL